MLPNNFNFENRIQSYIDGLCNEEESAEISKNISTIPTWKESYNSLLEIHLMLQTEMESMEPSMRFNKNVMDQIAGIKIAKPARQYLNPMIIWMIGVVMATMLVWVLGYAISLADWSVAANSTTLKMPELKLPIVDWDALLNSKLTILFLMINTVLGLTICDKWFKRKKSAF